MIWLHSAILSDSCKNVIAILSRFRGVLGISVYVTVATGVTVLATEVVGGWKQSHWEGQPPSPKAYWHERIWLFQKIQRMKEGRGSFLTEEEKIGGEETRAEDKRDRRLERANPRPPAGAPRDASFSSKQNLNSIHAFPLSSPSSWTPSQNNQTSSNHPLLSHHFVLVS